MNRILVSTTLAGFGIAAAALLLWPRSDTSAQVNAEGCTCSRATQVGSGREQLSLYYCACPAMQCVVTATAAGSSAPPNVVQSCRVEGASGQSNLIGPLR